jgi:hypothetical protein
MTEPFGQIKTPSQLTSSSDPADKTAHAAVAGAMSSPGDAMQQEVF